jgi:hypothetical protein
VSHPSPESTKLLAVDRGFSLQYFFSHLFLSARYRPFQSSWRRGLFPQKFQHSTPTTPLNIQFTSESFSAEDFIDYYRFCSSIKGVVVAKNRGFQWPTAKKVQIVRPNIISI